MEPTSPDFDKQAQLALRMKHLGIKESDLVETFVRSGGHGGQNVNKTSTCVLVIHKPTGVQVKSQSTRQQGLNRLIARQLLLDKIEQTRALAAQRARQATEKTRRRNRRPSRAARERNLEEKNRRARKKAGRRASWD